MSKIPHTRRHQPPSPSRWLILFKVIVAIGQVVSFIKDLFDRYG